MERLSEREIHENQVLTKEQLTVGVIVQSRNTLQPTYQPLLIILGEPYQDEKNRWWVVVLHCELGNISTISLADNGVVPYPDNAWNSWHYLIAVENTSELMISVSVRYKRKKKKFNSPSIEYNPLKRPELVSILCKNALE